MANVSAQSDRALRLGIIGAGKLASSRIYPCLHYLPVELVAVCDLDEQRAKSAAKKFGASETYTDHAVMLAKAEVDAVILCVGPDEHAQLAIEVMEAGIPVYTEKPPAVSADAARVVREVSRRTGLVCMTGFKKRFAPAYEKLQHALTSGEMGAPSLLSIDYASGSYGGDSTNPRNQFLLDFAIHIIDLSRFLFGEVAEVYAKKLDAVAYAVTLAFASGAVGTLALSANRDWSVSTEKVEVTGGPGQFATVENSVRMSRHSMGTIVDWNDPSFSTAAGDSLRETGFAGELVEFVDAVREGRKPESSIESSHRTMCLYEAIKESAESGRSVLVRYDEDEGDRP